MNKESLKHKGNQVIGKISGEVFMHGIVPEVVDPNNNLVEAREYLKTGSGVLLFNHAGNDFGMWARFIRENLTDLGNTAALVSMRYLDPEQGKSGRAFSYFMEKWNAAYGLEAFPLVQAKDNDKYPNHMRINGKSLIKARKFLSEKGRIIAFSPEGTRSPNGQLQQAAENSDTILKLNESSIIIPAAAEFPTGYKMSPYMYAPISVYVGKPFFACEIDAEHEQNPNSEKRDLVMQHVADLLPPKNRGYYR